MRHLSSGLVAGRPAPGLGALDDEHRGVRHLVVFVDPDCAACDALVPALQRLAHDRRLPRTILVSRGDPANARAPWREAGGRIRWMTESGTALSDAYEVDVTPTAFVVDEAGLIVAGGPTATIEDVVALTDGTDGVRVAPGTTLEDVEASRGTR
jgi:protein-disulfide isomerase